MRRMFRATATIARMRLVKRQASVTLILAAKRSLLVIDRTERLLLTLLPARLTMARVATMTVLRSEATPQAVVMWPRGEMMETLAVNKVPLRTLLQLASATAEYLAAKMVESLLSALQYVAVAALVLPTKLLMMTRSSSVLSVMFEGVRTAPAMVLLERMAGMKLPVTQGATWAKAQETAMCALTLSLVPVLPLRAMPSSPFPGGAIARAGVPADEAHMAGSVAM